MLSSMPKTLIVASFILAVGCGSATPAANTKELVEERIINADSLLEAMDVRYNQLCAERKAAYSERDAELRQELLERNDAACKALDDSLCWVVNYKKEVKN